MSCKAAKFDPEEGRYQCAVSGDGCIYMRPDSKRCAEEYGEGPDSNIQESKVEMTIMDLNKVNKNGCIRTEEGFLHHELKSIDQIEFKD